MRKSGSTRLRLLKGNMRYARKQQNLSRLCAATLVITSVAILAVTNANNSLMQLSTEVVMPGRLIALRVGVQLGARFLLKLDLECSFCASASLSHHCGHPRICDRQSLCPKSGILPR